jgi:hypothetical protein
MPRVYCSRRKSSKTCVKPDANGGGVPCKWNDDLNTCSPILSKQQPVATKQVQRVEENPSQLCATNSRGNHRRGVKPFLIDFALRHGQDPKQVQKWTIGKLCEFLRQVPPKVDSQQPIVKAKDILATIQQMSKSKEAPKLYAELAVLDRVGYAKAIENVLQDAQRGSLLKDCDIISKDKTSPAPFWAKKRIGTSSINGEAHLVIHKSSFSPPLMFVMKVIPDYFGHRVLKKDTAQKEFDLYRKLGKLVKQNVCPHFPLSYDLMSCSKECKYINTELVKRNASKECRYMFNERAAGDLRSWMLRKPRDRTVDDMGSMYMQVFLGAGVMHAMGYTHDDLHWGNVLYHEMPEHTIGKYWHYKIYDQDVYILNRGQLWLLWDFGEVRTHGGYVPFPEDQLGDLQRLFGIPEWVVSATLDRGMKRGAVDKEVVKMVHYMHNKQMKLFYEKAGKHRVKVPVILGVLFVLALAESHRFSFIKTSVPLDRVINAQAPYTIGGLAPSLK